MSDWEIKAVITFFGFAGMLLGVLIRRLYKANDLLFRKYDTLKAEYHVISLWLIAKNPEDRDLLRALIGGGAK